MKFLIITLHADPTIQPGAAEGGGTHLYINELINLFIYKQENALFITRKASAGKNQFEYGKVRIKRILLGPQSHWEKSNLDNKEKLIQKIISRQLKIYKFIPDIIHSVYWHSGRAGIFFSRLFNVPLVHTVISNGIRKKMAGYKIANNRIETEINIFNAASIIISVSQQERKDLIDFYNVNPNKIKVIGRSVDNLFITKLYDKNGTLLAKTILDNEIK